MIELEEDVWWNKFQPMKNHITPLNGYLFETYGNDSQYIYSIDHHFVWTQMDGDDGGVYLVEGRHFVNRIAYYVTSVPWLEGESYDICIIEPEPNCYECGDALLTQEELDAKLCSNCKENGDF